MVQQIPAPVGESLGLSFQMASQPVVVILVLLGVIRRPAWRAALAGLLVAAQQYLMAWINPTVGAAR